MIEYGHVAATEGPWLALAGLELAWLREVTRRYGGPEWEIGMPTSNHAHAQLLDYLEARCDTIHASERHISVETRSMRVCDDCERRLPLSEFAEVEGYRSVICESCASGRDVQAGDREERKPRRLKPRRWPHIRPTRTSRRPASAWATHCRARAGCTTTWRPSRRSRTRRSSSASRRACARSQRPSATACGTRRGARRSTRTYGPCSSRRRASGASRRPSTWPSGCCARQRTRACCPLTSAARSCSRSSRRGPSACSRSRSSAASSSASARRTWRAPRRC
jgi:hypothetical protein